MKKVKPKWSIIPGGAAIQAFVPSPTSVGPLCLFRAIPHLKTRSKSPITVPRKSSKKKLRKKLQAPPEPKKFARSFVPFWFMRTIVPEIVRYFVETKDVSFVS